MRRVLGHIVLLEMSLRCDEVYGAVIRDDRLKCMETRA